MLQFGTTWMFEAEDLAALWIDLYTGSTLVGHFPRSPSSASFTQKSFELIIISIFSAVMAAWLGSVHLKVSSF